MPIVSEPVAVLSARDEVLYEVGFLIDEAASSPDDIEPYKLADTILELVEAKINSVDHVGNVIYRV